MVDTVNDNASQQRFVYEEDGHQAELTYHLNGKRLVLLHTGVPEAMEGRGIGGLLVKAAVARAQRDGLTLVPRCEFAKGWLERHPDEVAKTAIDWN